MKITLLMPPTNQEMLECFLFPALALPVLAGHLRANGFVVMQEDLDIRFQARLGRGWKRSDFAVLKDSRVITDYLSGRLPQKESRAVEKVEERLFSLGSIGKSDLFGISLLELKTVYHLNSAALLANRIKKLYSAPVVIGNRTLSSPIYQDILSRYPVFDYAVYAARGGEEPLLQLVRKLAGDKSARLSGTIERLPGGALKDHPEGCRPLGKCVAPDYKGFPLEKYSLTGGEILSRYNCGYPAFRKILAGHGDEVQKVVATQLETSCRGACAFCCNRRDMKFSDRRPTGEILAELAGLKAGGATGIYFMDPQFNDSYAKAEELCDGMIKRKLGLQWCDCVNGRELDENLLTKMRASGAVKLTFGMETGSPRLIKYIRKGVNLEKIQRLLRFSHSLGIWNNIELIGGLPTETEADVAATIDFIKANRDVIDTYSLNTFWLFPGTPFARDPGLYGIKLRPARGVKHRISPNGRIIHRVEKFDEVGGLDWEAKNRQIKSSTRRVAAAIRSVAPPVNIESYHVNLLLYLYRVFGHEKKDLIRKLMRVATARFKPYYLDSFIVPRFDVRR